MLPRHNQFAGHFKGQHTLIGTCVLMSPQRNSFPHSMPRNIIILFYAMPGHDPTDPVLLPRKRNCKTENKELPSSPGSKAADAVADASHMPGRDLMAIITRFCIHPLPSSILLPFFLSSLCENVSQDATFPQRAN